MKAAVERSLTCLRAHAASGRVLERAIVILAGLCYGLTASRSVEGGDSGEFAAVGAHGGVAHPPGYPLYVLWLRATAWVPATSSAHRAALATAVLGAASVYALQRACRAWGASASVTIFVSSAYAASPLAWRLATEPEVFTLNVLIAMLIVASASPKCATKPSSTRRVATLALLAGLGVSNHHSVIFLAPLGLLAVGRSLATSTRWLRTALVGLAALAVGLSPYAYIVWTTRSTPLASPCVWGDARDISGLLRHFLRVDYGTTRLAVSTQEPEVLAQLGHLGKTLLMAGIGPILLIAPLAWFAIPPRRRWSWDIAALVASLGLAGPLFVSRFNLSPRGLTGLVVDRFHLLPLALASVIAALALEHIMRGVRGRLSSATMLGLALGAGTAVSARAMSTSVSIHAQHRSTLANYLENVLALLPPNAIVLVTSDDQVGGFEYMQCALGARRDVDVISPHLLLTSWYAQRTSARMGFEVERGELRPGVTEPVLDSTRLLEQLLDTGRPLFVTRWFADHLESTFASYPIGPVIRVMPGWEHVPPPAVLYEWNTTLLTTMSIESTPPPATTWPGARFVDYARPWMVLATAFERQGDSTRARLCRARAAALTPQ